MISHDEPDPSIPCYSWDEIAKMRCKTCRSFGRIDFYASLALPPSTLVLVCDCPGKTKTLRFLREGDFVDKTKLRSALQHVSRRG